MPNSPGPNNITDPGSGTPTESPGRTAQAAASKMSSPALPWKPLPKTKTHALKELNSVPDQRALLVQLTDQRNGDSVPVGAVETIAGRCGCISFSFAHRERTTLRLCVNDFLHDILSLFVIHGLMGLFESISCLLCLLRLCEENVRHFLRVLSEYVQSAHGQSCEKLDYVSRICAKKQAEILRQKTMQIASYARPI